MYKNMNQGFRGPLRRNPANPRYFTDAGGEAIYLTGSHNWSVMNDMWLEGDPEDRANYEGFLEMMAANHHNFLRFWQFNMHSKGAPWNPRPTRFDPLPQLRTGPGVAADGKPKFDLTRFDDSYFNRLRERIERAGELGIYVSVMLFEAWAYKNAGSRGDPWPYSVYHPDNRINDVNDDPVVDGRAVNLFSLHCPEILALELEYVKHVVETVNEYDNVLFEICNEIPDTPDAMAWQDHVCRFIRECELALPKQHMIGITAEGGNQKNGALLETSADWISPGSGEMFEYRYNPPATTGDKVVLLDTDHLWGHGGDAVWIWKAFTRGHNVLFMDPWFPIPGDLDWWQDGDVTRNQRFYYAWDPIRRNLGYTRQFALMMNLNTCLPAPELCTSSYCLAAPNSQYLCFLPEGPSHGLDLRGAKGELSLSWFDPNTGRTHPGGKVPGGQRLTLSSPFGAPAVAFLYRTRRELERKYEIVS